MIIIFPLIWFAVAFVIAAIGLAVELLRPSGAQGRTFWGNLILFSGLIAIPIAALISALI